MNLLKSSNPALSTHRFKEQAIYDTDTKVMTVQGTINKSILMLLLVIATATFTWSRFIDGENISLYIGIGLIGGLITALVHIPLKADTHSGNKRTLFSKNILC